MYQIQHSANKAQNIAEHLSRLMANIGDPLPARWRLLMEVVNRLYTGKIWYATLDVKKRATFLVAVQRTVALRIASAYCVQCPPQPYL